MAVERMILNSVFVFFNRHILNIVLLEMKLPFFCPRAEGHWEGPREYESKHDTKCPYIRVKSEWAYLEVRGSSVWRSRNDSGSEGI